MFQALSFNKEVPAALRSPLSNQSANLGAELEHHGWSVHVFGGRLKKRQFDA